MTPEVEIKQFAIQRGAKLAGIASVTDINKYAPPGHRPDDILIGAKSVIVIAVYPRTLGAWHSPKHQAMSASSDFTRVRGGITLAIANLIESEYGYYSLADMPPAIGLNPSLSLKLCAEMAGMGTRSMAGGIILNRELGFIGLAACITTMLLKADVPVKEPICPHPSCVQLWEKRRTTPCLEVCPECLSGELEGRRIKWIRFDRRICSTRAQNLSPVSYQRLLLEGINEPDPEVRRSMLLGSFSRNALQAIASGAVIGQCGECLRHCPICIRARSLKGNNTNKANSSKPVARRHDSNV